MPGACCMSEVADEEYLLLINRKYNHSTRIVFFTYQTKISAEGVPRETYRITEHKDILIPKGNTHLRPLSREPLCFQSPCYDRFSLPDLIFVQQNRDAFFERIREKVWMRISKSKIFC